MFLCLLFTSLFTVTAGRSVSASECSGAHGVYTSILCQYDRAAGEGAYIHSPNGAYRMYISSGHVVVYNVSDWGNWVLEYYMYGGSTTAWAFEFGPTYYAEHGLVIRDYPGNTLVAYNGGVGSSGYIKLDDDGCLRVYWNDDTPNWTFACPS